MDIAYIPFVEIVHLVFSEVLKHDITEGRPKLGTWLEVHIHYIRHTLVVEDIYMFFILVNHHLHVCVAGVEQDWCLFAHKRWSWWNRKHYQETFYGTPNIILDPIHFNKLLVSLPVLSSTYYLLKLALLFFTAGSIMKALSVQDASLIVKCMHKIHVLIMFM